MDTWEGPEGVRLIEFSLYSEEYAVFPGEFKSNILCSVWGQTDCVIGDWKIGNSSNVLISRLPLSPPMKTLDFKMLDCKCHKCFMSGCIENVCCVAGNHFKLSGLDAR